MKTQINIRTLVLWTARITGTAMALFVTFFIVAHAFGNEETGNGFQNISEIITFIFFPIGVTAGLFISLWKERLGAIITLVGLAALFTMRVDLIDNFQMVLPAIPAILYFTYAQLQPK